MDAQQAYKTYRPLLLRALSGLARQGYVLAPDEGLDLVHDFFIEVWPALVQRHDPKRAQLGTFAYRAFVQFARPRIIRLNRWRHDDAERVELTGDATQGDELGSDLHKVRAALDKLARADRELLLARFDAQDSDRRLAKRHGVTRYRIRERLGDALAQLVSILHESSLVDARDWPLIKALWGEGLSPEAVALQLGLTTVQVKHRRQRVLEALFRAFPAGTGGSDYDDQTV